MSTTYAHRSGLDRTKDVLRALSYDSRATDDHATIAAGLRTMYRHDLTSLRLAVGEMLEDDGWSQDREPYEWLAAIAEHLAT